MITTSSLAKGYDPLYSSSPLASLPVSGLPKTIHLGETSMMEEYKNLYFPNIKCNYLSISLDFFSDFVFLSFY
jgi:hypothetical protein